MASPQDRFAALASEVAREVVRRRSSDVCCGDLTLEQFETLRAVAGSDAATIGSLAAALGVDLSTMSRNVSVLERNGSLRRSRTADDGRVVRVQLTSKGSRALATLQCGERDVLDDIYVRIPAGSRESILSALDVLRSCLADAAATAACCAPSLTPPPRAPPRRRA